MTPVAVRKLRKNTQNVVHVRNLSSSQIPKCNVCHIQNLFTKKCSSKSSPSWTCTECVDKILPFAALNDNEMILELKGKNINNVDLLDLPSYRMKSLLEKIPV